MDVIEHIFDIGKDLSVSQMCCRAVVIYFAALVLIRISGRRTFGKKSAFDNTVALLLGAVLSRAVVGASPFVPTVASCLALVVLHRFMDWLTLRYDFIRKHVKGEQLLLFKNGQVQEENLAQAMMNKKDLMSDIRTQGGTNSLAEIEEVYMESSGKISVVKKS